MRRILSIDIGIVHFGMVFAELDENYFLKKITGCKLINLCDYSNKTRNGNCLAIRLKNFLNEHNELFKVDFILAERQPPEGLMVIQEMLIFNFPNIYLVSPRGMHYFFEISDLDYDGRKVAVEKLATKLLRYDEYNNATRKHDMADALCLLKYWIFKEGTKFREQLNLEIWRSRNQKVIKHFASFKYNGE